jgi:regulator of protease activity HflC (stomatin/prohibitin superfamily)
MDLSTIFLLLLTASVMIVLTTSSKVIAENQRAVVLRLGKFLAVVGPGFHVGIPFVDKLEIVNLNHDIPGWQRLSEHELNERVKSAVLSR